MLLALLIWTRLGMRSKEGRFNPSCRAYKNPQGLSVMQAGVNSPSLLRFLSNVFVPVALVILPTAARAQSLAPEILKVDPPSWWIRSSANPIRLLIRGRNLQNCHVRFSAIGVRIVGAPKVNERGTYAFVDISIASNAKAGKHELNLRTSHGAARASFEVLPALNRQNRFQGFSPSDVLYLIMLDRFNDGDPSNNDPPQSRGLYDRSNKFYYHGGDLQGVIN